MKIIKNTNYISLIPEAGKKLAKKNNPLIYYDELTVPPNANLNNIIEVEKEILITDTPIVDSSWQNLLDSQDLQKAQTYLIKYTKDKLEEFLQENPLQYNGKYYSVTTTAQTHLDSLISAANDAADINISFVPYWNDINGKREPWTLTELKILRIQIQAYILNYIRQQQEMEELILNAKTINDLYGLSFAYQK